MVEPKPDSGESQEKAFEIKKLKIEHLERIKEDVRDEIKRRIRQRDNYSIQQVVILGIVAAAIFSKEIPFQDEFVLFVPVIPIYFTVLILFSYRIHRIISTYLRCEIEPKLAEYCGTDQKNEFEIYYKDMAVPGIRKKFFFILMVSVIFISMSYYASTDNSNFNQTVTVLVTIAYMIISIIIAIKFSEDLNFTKNKKKGNNDDCEESNISKVNGVLPKEFQSNS